MSKSSSLITYEGLKFGSGHKLRSRSIQSELEQMGYSSSIYVISDAIETHELRDVVDSDILIIDIPSPLQKSLGTFLHNKKFVALDWSEPCAVPEINIAAYKNQKLTYPAKRFTVCGPKYLIVPNATDSKQLQIETTDTLIILGASPSHNKLQMAIEFASTLGNNTLVVGNTDLGHETKNDRVQYLGFVETPLDFMRKAKNVITNAGVSLLQSLFVGHQPFAWPQNPNEVDFLRNFVAKMANLTELQETNGSLSARKSYSGKPTDIIDGQGAFRIAQLLVD